MLRSISLVGRIAQDLELRGQDKKLLSTSIAVSRGIKDAKGNYPTDFYRLIILGSFIETVQKVAEKGDLVGVVGKPQISKSVVDDKTYVNVEVVVDQFWVIKKKSNVETEQSNEEEEDDDINNMI